MERQAPGQAYMGDFEIYSGRCEEFQRMTALQLRTPAQADLDSNQVDKPINPVKFLETTCLLNYSITIKEKQLLS